MASKTTSLGCTLVVRPLYNFYVPSINTPAPDG